MPAIRKLFIVISLDIGLVVRQLEEIYDIMGTNANRKLYGNKWAMVIADSETGALKACDSLLSRKGEFKTSIVFGKKACEVIVASEGTNAT